MVRCPIPVEGFCALSHRPFIPVAFNSTPGNATPPSKIVMDAIGAKEILYHVTIREPEIKLH